MSEIHPLVLYFLLIMTNPKKIEYASFDVTSTYPYVSDGQIYFTEESNRFTLKNFQVPDHVNTEDDLRLYLNELLYDSSCDIASICDVYVADFSEV